MYCTNCGKELSADTHFCSECGKQVAEFSYQVPTSAVSPKSRLALSLLAWFGGIFGLHRFYLGHYRRGAAFVGLYIVGLVMCVVSSYSISNNFNSTNYLRTGFPEGSALVVLILGVIMFYGAWIWAFVDLFFAATGRLKDRHGRPVSNWN